MFLVQKLSVVLLVLVLSACTTPPQKEPQLPAPKIKAYPEAPKELMLAPPVLVLLGHEETLDTVTAKITENYSTYHQVVEQLKALQAWTIKIREESLKNVDDRDKKNQ